MALDDQNDLSYGLDTNAAQNADPSVFESLGNIATKAVPLTALSVVNSFANTGIMLSNWMSSPDSQTPEWTVPAELQDGDNAELSDYYQQHQQGIEGAGLIAGALIPGTLALKGFKYGTTALVAYRAARAGELTGAIARATGLLPGVRQAEIIRDSLQAISADGVQAGLTADKFKAIALGFGDQAIQGAVFQAATYATMSQSPLLKDADFGDVVDFIKDGALVGGAVGGLLEGIGTRSLFNKALLAANTKAMGQLVQGELGKGAYLGSDRILQSVVNTLYEQPAATNTLQALNASGTSQAIRSRVLGSFMGLSAGDADLSSAMTDMVINMKDNLNYSKEDAYDKLGRLAQVTRIGQNGPEDTNGETFYLSRFAKSATGEQLPLVSDVIGNTQQPAAKWSLAYRLRAGSAGPRIASMGATVSDEVGSSSAALFPTAGDAWESGYDIWLNKNNEIYVNPNAPNIEQAPRLGESRILSRKEAEMYSSTGQLPEGSAPLYGGQIKEGAQLSDSSRTAPATYINLKDGTLLNSVDATAADYGPMKLVADGVLSGAEHIPQSATTGLITAESTTQDATARYAWASMRGIKRGDIVDTSDIPMLEQLYRNVQKDPDFVKSYRVGTTDQGWQELHDSGDILGTLGDHLYEAKNSLISDLLQAAKEDTTINSKSISLRAGVPEQYILDNMPHTNISELLSSPADYLQPAHAQLHYDIGNLTVQDGQIQRGAIDWQYRKQLIQDNMQAAATANLGEHSDDFLIRQPASAANITGAGPSFLGFARGAYNSLAAEAERVGRFLTLRTKDDARIMSEQLGLHTARINSQPELAAELRYYFTGLQSTGEKFLQLPEALQQRYFPDAAEGSTVRVLLSSMKTDAKGNFIDWLGDTLPAGFRSGADAANNQRAPLSYYTLSKNASEFMATHTSLNDQRIYAINKLQAAWGMSKQLRAGLDYAPPIDTSKYNHIAYIRFPDGSGANDGGVGVITGNTADELQAKAAQLEGMYQVITKQDIKNFRTAQGDYDSSLNFSQTAVNSSMQRAGILNEIMPNVQPQRMVDDIVNWHMKQNVALLRANVETMNSQLFAELKAMGEVDGRFKTSTANLSSTILGASNPGIDNPYRSYVDTALAVGNKEKYSLWSQTQDKITSTFDTAFNVLQNSFQSAAKGLMPYTEASELAQKFGLGNPYAAGAEALGRGNYLGAANQLPPSRALTGFLSQVNAVMGALVIKLDPFQQMLHAISTPIMTLAEASSVKQLINTELPDGSGRQVPAASKVLFNAVTNFFNGTSKEYMPLYQRLGLITKPEQEYQFRQILDAVRFPGDGKLAAAQQKLQDITQTAQKFTLANWSETFTSYMAADAGRQIFEAAGYEGKQLEDNIINFANRIKGNFIASQRPIAFQGPIGQAIGLFQTYQTNLYQNFFRYVANGEGRTIATLAGAQTFLFGYSSLPGFAALNNAVVGNWSGNPAHNDLYGGSYNLLDKTLAPWLLYGTASNLLNANFFTRGDVNPRNITFLPVNPANWPVVRGAINLVGNIYDTAQKLTQGGNTGASLLTALEHNGLNRPLQGLAQLAQGYSTTSKGDLISSVYPQIQDSNTMGLNELWNMGVFSRLAGARPLDEAITLDAVYRKSVAQATDVARMQQLGKAVKTSLYAGSEPTGDQVTDFVSDYAKNGGNIKNFSRSFLRWNQEANSSVANQIYRGLRDPRAHNMMQIMGGQPLADFTQSPDYQAAPVE